MTAEQYAELVKDVETAITTKGDFVEDACIVTMCSMTISQPYDITPRQLAELMDTARAMAHRNLDRWLKMPPKKLR